MKFKNKNKLKFNKQKVKIILPWEDQVVKRKKQQALMAKKLSQQQDNSMKKNYNL